MDCDKGTACPYHGLHSDERITCAADGCKVKATLDRLCSRYEQACHAVQSGVKAQIAIDGPMYDHAKHLRVGVNMRAVENAALVQLMIRKGIITDVEWFQELAEKAEEEVATYEKMLSAHFGRSVKLY